MNILLRIARFVFMVFPFDHDREMLLFVVLLRAIVRGHGVIRTRKGLECTNCETKSFFFSVF